MVEGFFFNPNIHPYLEYRKRLETLEDYASRADLKVFFDEEYPMEEFLRGVAFQEKERCRSCYRIRLARTAETAVLGRYDGFTTTLLYSRFQNHEWVKETGERLGKHYGIAFIYRDFRKGWKEGIEASRALGLYRQSYCGCLYSEKERYTRGRKP